LGGAQAGVAVVREVQVLDAEGDRRQPMREHAAHAGQPVVGDVGRERGDHRGGGDRSAVEVDDGLGLRLGSSLTGHLASSSRGRRSPGLARVYPNRAPAATR